MAKTVDQSADEKRKILAELVASLSNYRILEGGNFFFSFEGRSYRLYFGEGMPPDPPPGGGDG